jgi:beta-N-acetylhexosaminidase
MVRSESTATGAGRKAGLPGRRALADDGDVNNRRSGHPWRLVAVVAVAALIVVSAVTVAVRTLSGGTGHRPARTGGGPASSPATSGPASGPAPSPGTSSAPALTARQLAGQRVIYSYPGLTPPAGLLEHIRNGEAAGVIFFSDNVSSTAQIASVIRVLRQAQQQSPIRAPLLLLTDQEGGQVKRLPGEPSESARQVGRSADPAAAAGRAGAGAAATLAAVGMNVNLAPVLDVYASAGNFIDQQQRSFSNDPRTVATLGAAFVTAQQNAGVAATAKHFPGLGAAARGENTDTGPVTVTVNLSRLRANDELPYSAAIAAGVKLVMVSWAVYPALDPARPAGLSPVVVGSELRDRMRFRGVTITDALEARALQGIGDTGRRAVLAAQAGMDLVLCSARDVTQGESATTALAGALTGGQLDPGAFRVAVERVTTLRTGLS